MSVMGKDDVFVARIAPGAPWTSSSVNTAVLSFWIMALTLIVRDHLGESLERLGEFPVALRAFEDRDHLLVALALNFLPTSAWPWMPDWIALVTIFWSIREPRRVGMGSGFILGLAIGSLWISRRADAAGSGLTALAALVAMIILGSVMLVTVLGLAARQRPEIAGCVGRRKITALDCG